MEKQPAQAPLQMKEISKTFPGVRALSEVSLEVRKGEVHGLVGKNGAGKSTLMAVLMGLIDAESGTITIAGRHFTSISPAEALEAGVAYVPQRMNMMSALTVAENVLVGNMPVNRLGFVDWREVNREAERRLASLGLTLDVRSKVEGLGVADQTMLAIAKALFSKAKLIILDEPTAALPRPDIDRLFGFVKSLRETGVAFIYISHHLEEVFGICDRVTVLRNGQLVGTYEVRNLDATKLARLMVGEEVKEFERTRDHKHQGNPVLVLDNMVRKGHYEDVHLSLWPGEVVGLAGLEGCGASTLAKALFGLDRRGGGSVSVKGLPFLARTPQEALSKGVAYLPQDRYLYGLVGLRPVRENITYPILDRLVRFFAFVNQSKEKKLVEEYIQQLGIVTPSTEQTVSNLSGGNQQKVIFAKLAATRPNVLVLHEPTMGIDVQAKVDIYRIVSNLSEQGVAILIISSEVRELLGVCDHILVMYEGRVQRDFVVGEPDATPENILLAIEGGAAHVQK